MSKTASIGLLPSSTLFGRLMASIDRLLIASSRIAIRNGDLPRLLRAGTIRRTTPASADWMMAPASGAIFFCDRHRLYQRLRQISPNGNQE
jgi:hypothetical protein